LDKSIDFTGIPAFIFLLKMVKSVNFSLDKKNVNIILQSDLDDRFFQILHYLPGCSNQVQ